MTKKGGRFSYATEKPAQLTRTVEPAKQAKLEEQAQPVKQAELGVLAQIAGPTDALLNPAAYVRPAMKRGRRAAGEDVGVKRTDVPSEQLNVRIRPELKRAAAGFAGLNGLTLGDVVEAALVEYLESKRG